MLLTGFITTTEKEIWDSETCENTGTQQHHDPIDTFWAFGDQVRFTQRNNEVIVALHSGNLHVFLHFNMNTKQENRGGVE